MQFLESMKRLVSKTRKYQWKGAFLKAHEHRGG